jgi:hypothetical protein
MQALYLSAALLALAAWSAVIAMLAYQRGRFDERDRWRMHVETTPSMLDESFAPGAAK